MTTEYNKQQRPINIQLHGQMISTNAATQLALTYRGISDDFNAHAGALSLASGDALYQRTSDVHVSALHQSQIGQQLVNDLYKFVLGCGGWQSHRGAEHQRFSWCGGGHERIVLHHVRNVLSVLDGIDQLIADAHNAVNLNVLGTRRATSKCIEER